MVRAMHTYSGRCNRKGLLLYFDRDDICFATEAFCCVAVITPVSASSVPEYLERAVTFANETLDSPNIHS